MRKSVILPLLFQQAYGFSPVHRAAVIAPRTESFLRVSPIKDESNTHNQQSDLLGLGATAFATALLTPFPAEAAAGPVPSALVAYAHYLSFIGMTAALVVERCVVKANMSDDDENTFTKADAAYGIFSVGLFASGYFRVVEYGKGWEFYSHEPIFWLKMVFFTILGSVSLFPTITIIKRVVERNDGKVVAPMSEKLASRMKTLINAELTAIASIPLAATLMSRGVLYMDEFPWQLGAAFTALVSAGLVYKYAKEALTWKEEELLTLEDS